jgi:hypothetical protein
MARGDSERRNKRKNKRKEKKKHPYRKGGGKRSMNLGKK